MAKKIIIVPLLFCFCMGLGLFSTLVWGQSEMPISTSKPLPHEYVKLLGDAVDTLVAQKVLNPGQGISLKRKLSLARSELNKGSAPMAIRHLESFSEETQGLLQARVLNSTQGQFLIAGSAAAQERINTLAFGLCFTDRSPVSWSLLPCGEHPACRYTTYHVNMGSHIQGARNGSQEAPFNTINEALQRAAVLRLCGVEVLVATGHYIEDPVISRDTRIRGLDSRDRVVIVGSIINQGGYWLNVENLTISSSPAPGAIVVTAPCASTTITGVTIDRAERYGIYQRGGTLKVTASEILRTRALADAVSAGTGVYLTGGVQAVLGLVTVDGNDSGGLFAEGAQTRVYAAAVAITDTSINPYFIHQISSLDFAGAAVTAQQGALVLMEFCTISGNQWTGLGIHGGAQAHFRYGTITRTSAVPCTDPQRSPRWHQRHC